MSIIEKLHSLKADWINVALIKVSVFAAALLLAKWWPSLLCLEWYWYLIIAIVAAIRPVFGTCKSLKKE